MSDITSPRPLSLDGALALRDRIAAGKLSATALVEDCLARIAAREDVVQAWAWIDPDHARAQASALDAAQAAGRPLGPLHGLPVGIKDVIDTAGIPTENGCPLDRGRVPEADAFVVDRLRAAGAVVMGKTVTTELAYMHPGKTRNPHDPDHTPGGSSSGSAAAVADGMVPLAIGTQTGGSVIRPASFCGIAGFKPSFGAIPRRGMALQSHSLDTIGVFGAGPLDAALLADALFGHDRSDPATAAAPPPALLRHAAEATPRPPRFAFVQPPAWDRVDPDLRAALESFAAGLGADCVKAALPPSFEAAADARRIINFAEMAHHYARYWHDGADILGLETRAAIEEGRGIAARDYLAALELPAILNRALETILAGADAILCPAALGPAPAGLGSTGDSIMNGLWTLCGTPAVTLPLLRAENGLPMGVQLVGRRGDDARLLRNAQWLWQRQAGTGN